ncbi:GNAT family N-acetyltransferase [Inquilinus sp. Marseille-Q2685]|uniref:GNAT family N-acetyltransferase n=1 Tax=Inquilinus sp. Marseille-Q2685 TaxID=2866581 RepID=UPI001CE4AD99|nr:GNAT family N-acetyltransferase [Inquilinus sp. Marseille-Q2685]
MAKTGQGGGGVAVTVRPMRGDAVEIAAVVALIRGAFADYIDRLDPPPSAVRETAESVAALLDREHGLVAEVGGAAVGCLFLQRRDGGDIYIGRVAVARAHRRGGVGRALMAAAEAEARRLGGGRLTLGVRLALDGNRRFFASLGFAEGALHAHPGYDRPTWLEMTKAIG